MSDVHPEITQQKPEQALSVRERAMAAVKRVVQTRRDHLIPTTQDLAANLSRRRFLIVTTGLLIAAGCGSEKSSDSSPVNSNTPEAPRPTPTSLTEVAQPDVPKKEKLPDDIVSPERLLQEYNTRVWNVPDVKLHIREKALEMEPIFNTMKHDELAKSFDIILLNGPCVHSSFLTPEEREHLPDLVMQLKEYEKPFEERYKQQFSNPEYRREYKNRFDQEIAVLEQRMRAGEIDRDTFIVESQATKERYYPFLEEPRPSDFQRTPAGGMYLRRSEYDGVDEKGFPKRVNKYYVVLPVKNEENKVFRSGNAVREIQSVGSGAATAPDPKKSFANGHEIKIVAPGTEYPAGGATGAGFSLRHEFAHHKVKHPEADMLPIEGLKAAYDAYQQGDTSKYYFVFETPKGNLYTKDHVASSTAAKSA